MIKMERDISELWLAFGRISDRLDGFEQQLRALRAIESVVAAPAPSDNGETTDEGNAEAQERARIEELRRRVWQSPPKDEEAPATD